MVNEEDRQDEALLSAASPLTQILLDDAYRRLIECFDDLPPEHQDALLLTRFEGNLTVENAAQVLEEDSETVKSWIDDALLTIEDRMGTQLAWYGKSPDISGIDVEQTESFLAGASNIEAIYRAGSTETCSPKIEERILATIRTSTREDDEVPPVTGRPAARDNLVERIKAFFVIPRFNAAVLSGAVAASFAIALALPVLTIQSTSFRGPVVAEKQDAIQRQPDQMKQWIQDLQANGQTREALALLKAFKELYPKYPVGDLEQLLEP